MDKVLQIRSFSPIMFERCCMSSCMRYLKKTRGNPSARCDNIETPKPKVERGGKRWLKFILN
eukprot:CCRYP_012332-RA/>CCRYP_012332-RA protein AED:0.00 eAED:0.00 QI:154/1/0.5/1/0/0/2/0/61